MFLWNFEPYQSHVVIFSNRKVNIDNNVKRNFEASSIDLNSDWKVTIGENSPVVMNKLHSWADDEATKYFSGTATYEKSVNIAPNLLQSSLKLDFGEPISLNLKFRKTE